MTLVSDHALPLCCPAATAAASSLPHSSRASLAAHQLGQPTDCHRLAPHPLLQRACIPLGWRVSAPLGATARTALSSSSVSATLVPCRRACSSLQAQQQRPCGAQRRAGPCTARRWTSSACARLGPPPPSSCWCSRYTSLAPDLRVWFPHLLLTVSSWTPGRPVHLSVMCGACSSSGCAHLAFDCSYTVRLHVGRQGACGPCLRCSIQRQCAADMGTAWPHKSRAGGEVVL
jgi:hypothetical protein